MFFENVSSSMMTKWIRIDSWMTIVERERGCGYQLYDVCKKKKGERESWEEGL